MQIKGTYFDGKSAKAHDAVLCADETCVQVKDAKGRPFDDIDDLLPSMSVAPKLGSTRRVIRFEGGRQFETPDFDGVKNLEDRFGLNRAFTFVGFLEARWYAVLLCFAGLVAFVTLAVTWGLPQFAKIVAFKLPPTAMDKVSRDALALFDKRVFKPSDLSEIEKTKIRKVFLQLTRETGKDRAFSLQFRKSKTIGANAFALPSGVIIITDDLVKTSQDIRELKGVLVHEISHITHRHAVRSVIQNTGVVLLISLLAGDVSSITSLAASIPTLLLESGYSRRFEIEADAAVGLYFLNKGWPLKFYEDILIRIVKDPAQPGHSDIFSTHPDLKERIERLKTYSVSAE